MTIPRVVLKLRRAKPFFARHPWVYAGNIAAVVSSPADGDEVEVVSHAGEFIARGLYNSQSKIRVRLYSWQPDVALEEIYLTDRKLHSCASMMPFT